MSFELRVVGRSADRVIVSVILDPGAGVVQVDGVAVQLASRRHEPLGPRLVLPISGAVSTLIGVQVELRANEALPPGALVTGALWWADGELRVNCSADPWTEIEAFVRGRHVDAPCQQKGLELRDDGDHDFETLEPPERARLVRMLPWVDRVGPVCPPVLAVDDAPEAAPRDPIADVCDEFGLDEENAAFLRALLEDAEDLDPH